MAMSNTVHLFVGFFIHLLMIQSNFLSHSEITDDAPIQVVETAKVPAGGIKSCRRAGEGYVRDVRIQALKIPGNEFVRHLVSDDDMTLFDDSTKKTFTAATDFLSCAQAAKSRLYNSFTFESGVCTAYLGWRSNKFSSCLPDATRVVYVAKTILTQIPKPAPTVKASASFDVTYLLDISVKDLGDASEGIKLAWDDQSVVLEKTQTSYRFSPALNVQCRNGTAAVITITSVDVNSEDNSDPIAVTLNDTADVDATWHLMKAGGCIHAGPASGAPSGTYDDQFTYCGKYNSKPYFAQKDGDFEAFQAALIVCGTRFGQFRVALQAVDSSQQRYRWYGGYEVDASEYVWTGSSRDACGAIDDSTEYRLFGVQCGSAVGLCCFLPPPPAL